MRKIFWDYKRAFMGLPLVPIMAKKVVIPPLIIFSTLITCQYLLASSVYYDEYHGNASEYIKK